MAVSGSKGMIAGAVALGLGGCLLAGFGTYAGIDSSLNMGRARMEQIMAAKKAGAQPTESSSSTSGGNASSSQNDNSGSNSPTSQNDASESTDKSGEPSSSDSSAANSGASASESSQAGATGHADVPGSAAPSETPSGNDSGQSSTTKPVDDTSASKTDESVYAAYAITWGDVLESISRRSGVSVDELARINGVSDLSLVCTETMVRVPATSGSQGQSDVGLG
jgi:spore germination protein KB